MTEAEVGGVRGDCLIIFQTVILPVTFLTTYLIATSKDHVEKEFPYISDTGTWPPESCIFGILLCFYSITSFLTVHIRWHILHEFASTTISSRLNNISLALGLLAAFGVLLVANFQETSQIVVHLIGAFLAFFIGGIYMWIQTFLTRRATDVPGFFNRVVYIRMAITIFTTISALLIVPFAAVANEKYRGNDSKTTDPGSGKWDSNLGGNDLHIASTSFEWALAGFVSLYFLTFIREFRFVRFGMPQLRHKMSTNQTTENSKGEYGGLSNHGME